MFLLYPLRKKVLFSIDFYPLDSILALEHPTYKNFTKLCRLPFVGVSSSKQQTFGSAKIRSLVFPCFCYRLIDVEEERREKANALSFLFILLGCIEAKPKEVINNKKNMLEIVLTKKDLIF
ncbi:hypothetical protein A7Q09_05865 [Methylacidiphilum sp. Yel]|jgi:hypothetical protein|uniref:hypothetical protein n=1 Tax=Methylacidiphilum sp. Yel TaxID=1847730 RepID=UPI001069205F|nr:hypothetical protein [Methylacidiphilum sp. Yel]TFE69219.1 hypothetical protein A7Q09_05865 [Methylacidiphilum sp. Yel]